MTLNDLEKIGLALTAIGVTATTLGFLVNYEIKRRQRAQSA